MKAFSQISLLLISLFLFGCDENESLDTGEWKRDANNPVFRDIYAGGAYQSASDGHIFYDENGALHMIYSGDVNDKSSIKLAKGTSLTEWKAEKPLLFEANNTGLDINKETAFYRKSKNGKHQIYYIGYPDENTYQSQIFLAEADQLEGPYKQMDQPIIPRGEIAGKFVYLITSPSVVEHDGKLHIVFIGWNKAPAEVDNIWIIGATSEDEGHTWSDFQLVDTPIGMEGQLTKTPDGQFIAVSTQEYKNSQGLFYAKSAHPFGPFETNETPIISRDNSELEKDDIIAPQITFDPNTGKEHLFYTGAEYQKGWWMMLATKQD